MKGPSEAEREKAWFKLKFLGQAGPHQVACEVRGGDPGYGETAKMLAEAALFLSFERDSLPRLHGVVPPVAALGPRFIDRLSAVGIGFHEL